MKLQLKEYGIDDLKIADEIYGRISTPRNWVHKARQLLSRYKLTPEKENDVLSALRNDKYFGKDVISESIFMLEKIIGKKVVLRENTENIFVYEVKGTYTTNNNGVKVPKLNKIQSNYTADIQLKQPEITDDNFVIYLKSPVVLTPKNINEKIIRILNDKSYKHDLNENETLVNNRIKKDISNTKDFICLTSGTDAKIIKVDVLDEIKSDKLYKQRVWWCNRNGLLDILIYDQDDDTYTTDYNLYLDEILSDIVENLKEVIAEKMKYYNLK